MTTSLIAEHGIRAGISYFFIRKVAPSADARISAIALTILAVLSKHLSRISNKFFDDQLAIIKKQKQTCENILLHHHCYKQKKFFRLIISLTLYSSLFFLNNYKPKTSPSFLEMVGIAELSYLSYYIIFYLYQSIFVKKFYDLKEIIISSGVPNIRSYTQQARLKMSAIAIKNTIRILALYAFNKYALKLSNPFIATCSLNFLKLTFKNLGQLFTENLNRPELKRNENNRETINNFSYLVLSCRYLCCYISTHYLFQRCLKKPPSFFIITGMVSFNYYILYITKLYVQIVIFKNYSELYCKIWLSHLSFKEESLEPHSHTTS